MNNQVLPGLYTGFMYFFCRHNKVILPATMAIKILADINEFMKVAHVPTRPLRDYKRVEDRKSKPGVEEVAGLSQT